MAEALCVIDTVPNEVLERILGCLEWYADLPVASTSRCARRLAL